MHITFLAATERASCDLLCAMEAPHILDALRKFRMALQETHQRTKGSQDPKAKAAMMTRKKTHRAIKQIHRTMRSLPTVIANQKEREVRTKVRRVAQILAKAVVWRTLQQRSMMKPQKTRKANRLEPMSRRQIQ